LYIADLVLAALMAGLLTSAFTLRAGTYTSVLILALIFIVAFVWSHFRNMRDAPTCEDCGRRFVPPQEPGGAEEAGGRALCPRCAPGDRSLAEIKREAANAVGVMLLFLLAVGLLAGLLMPYSAGLDSFGFGTVSIAIVVIAALGASLEFSFATA
jgi:hypothetical protein